MANSYLSGNTIRLEAIFTDFSGTATNPDIVKFILYDYAHNKISEITLGTNNRLSTGIYYADYTIPTDSSGKTFYYEFYGEIGGKPSLSRGEFKVSFI